MKVVVDDREPAEGVEFHLRDLPEVTVERRRLASGDYLVDDRLLFERKTFADFVQSLLDGRLFRQAARLARSPTKAVFILEGTAQDAAATGVRREALQGALITLALIFGLPILRSLDPGETARLMLYAAQQTGRAEAGAVTRPGYRPKGKHRRQLYVLQGLPHVGPERAQRMLETFGTVERVLQADAAALQSVKGIGRRTAEAIRWAVAEARAAYHVDSAPRSPSSTSAL